MRFKSKKQSGYVIYAVTGTDIVSFGIDFSDADISGLLGFAVERHDLTEDERYFMKGFKVFEEVFPDPKENVLVSTNEHPIQSFVWDDFTAKPNHEYEYIFYPLKGKPKFLDRQKPVTIKTKTEDLFTGKKHEHDVFFNRGVASSQEYTRRFKNRKPDKIEDPVERREAFDWLARKLKEAFFRFIDQAKKGDSLFGCFYEFHFQEAVDKFKEAIDRGVNVQLVIDCKVNESTDNDGKVHESFPREANLRALKKAKIPAKHFVKRTANKSNICHNKFLVLHKKGKESPEEVWMGSANISEGGIFGQTNAGHWIKNEQIAIAYKQYWDMLHNDDGGQEGAPTARKDNAAYKSNVLALTPDVTINDILTSDESIIPVFSPRSSKTMLDTYFELVDQASGAGCITLAFGVNKDLKEKLLNNNFKNAIVFMLLEKKDAPNAKSKEKEAFVRLNASHNVYEAYGSFIEDPLYKWARETNTQRLGLNKHVKYIHTKFLLHDPLGEVPIVVTGSANFSLASTTSNDENMVVIKGDQRAADIYFTEFNRLFNHYYFRSVLLDLKSAGKEPEKGGMFLLSDDSWTKKYEKGKLRMKRVELYTNMKGAVLL